MLDKVKEQSYVTFVGAPGSGKTATARHIALHLQKEEGYEILPIKEIWDIVNYSDARNPQVFVLDDILGVYAFDVTFFHTISKYENELKNPVMSRTKVLMTCRETVNRNEILSNTFLCDPKNVVFLNRKEHVLTDRDKFALFENYKLDKALLTTRTLKSSSNMFPYLCKLYSGSEKYKIHGPDFFISPVPYILIELARVKVENRLNYASLVLLMAYQNKLSKQILDEEKTLGTSISKEMRSKLLEKCKVDPNTSSFQFIDSLSDMEVTYTTKCENEYTFIHDSMFEIIAFSFGSEYPELMIQIMSSDYVADYIKVSKSDSTTNEEEMRTDNQQSNKKANIETTIDLSIMLSESSQHILLAERFFKDLETGKLYNVFRNEALKHSSVIKAFTDVIERQSYPKLYSVFLTDFLDKSDSHKYTEEQFFFFYICIHSLFKNENTHGRNIGRAISFVVYFGHYQILECIINRIKIQKGKVDDLFQNSYNTTERHNPDIDKNNRVTEQGNVVELVTLEQCRLLCLGCYSGDLPTVQILLKHVEKEAINNRTSRHPFHECFGEVPLSLACDSEFLIIFNNLLHADKDKPFAHKSNALKYIVETMEKEKADIFAKSLLFVTPLTIATTREHSNIVKELIKCGADISVKDTNGYSIIRTACRAGNLNTVKELLTAGVDTTQTVDSESTPVAEDHFEKVEDLEKGKMYVSPKISKRVSPFIVACYFGHLAIVEELIGFGIDVNKDDYLVTPLAAACSGGHLSVMKMLLKKGAYKTSTPSVKYVGHTGVVLKLVSLGIDVKTNDGSLIAACAHGHLDLSDKKFNMETDVNLTYRDKTPLIVACYFGHSNVVEELIKAGADVNLGNGFITPLQVACYEGHLNIVSKLLDSGAEVDLKHEEVTALAAACYFGHVDVVKKLLNSKVDVNQKSHGETPIEIATRNHYFDVGSELIKKGANLDPELRFLYEFNSQKEANTYL